MGCALEINSQICISENNIHLCQYMTNFVSMSVFLLQLNIFFLTNNLELLFVRLDFLKCNKIEISCLCAAPFDSMLGN
jgi:hypothetical protein